MGYHQGVIVKIFTGGYVYIQDKKTGQLYITNYCNFLNTGDYPKEIGLRKNSEVIFTTEEENIVECYFETKTPIVYKNHLGKISFFTLLLLLIPVSILIEIFTRIVALLSLVALLIVLSLPLIFLVVLGFYCYSHWRTIF